MASLLFSIGCLWIRTISIDYSVTNTSHSFQGMDMSYCDVMEVYLYDLLLQQKGEAFLKNGNDEEAHANDGKSTPLFHSTVF